MCAWKPVTCMHDTGFIGHCIRVTNMYASTLPALTMWPQAGASRPTCPLGPCPLAASAFVPRWQEGLHAGCAAATPACRLRHTRGSRAHPAHGAHTRAPMVAAANIRYAAPFCTHVAGAVASTHGLASTPHGAPFALAVPPAARPSVRIPSSPACIPPSLAPLLSSLLRGSLAPPAEARAGRSPPGGRLGERRGDSPSKGGGGLASARRRACPRLAAVPHGTSPLRACQCS